MAVADLQFVYFADPMCSWCWGFAPVAAELRRAYPEIPLRAVMGGLRPGTTEPMTEEAKKSTREHWEHVHEASGQPFDFGFFERDGFVYDTDPAARAVVAARRKSWAAALDYLERAQTAFYAEGKDTTSEDVLVALATDLGHEASEFRALLRSEEVKQETWSDYAISQRAGVTGFPTLILGPGPDGAYLPVSRGYQSAERVTTVVDYYLKHLASAAAGPAG